MTVRLHFNGPYQYRAKSAAMLCKATADVCLRRWRHGSIAAEWNFATELGTEILKRQLATAFEMPDVNEARRYLDAIAIRSSALSQVDTRDVALNDFRGQWFIPNDFQLFGYDIPQSAKAIKRIGEVIASRLPRKAGEPAAV